jgi:hypothetical protein
MPFSPRKCIGKNVKFTPIKRSQNTPTTRELLNVPPANKGNQIVNQVRIPKTAPKESTKWKWATTKYVS